MKTTPILAVCLAAAALAGIAGASPVMSGKAHLGSQVYADTMKAKGVQSSTERGAAPDRNIKTPETATNTKGAPAMPAPPNKGGAKTRGGLYIAHVDNHTSLYVQCYLNGSYMGTVGPYNDLYESVTSGRYDIYCKAAFDDGSSVKWGPSSYHSGNFTYSLYP